MPNKFLSIICLFISILLFHSDDSLAEVAEVQEDLTNEISDSALEALQAIEGKKEELSDTETGPDYETTVETQIEQVSELPESPDDEDIPVVDAESTDTVEEEVIVKDVVLVLDNSGSMKKNDPQFLTSQAVTEFITSLDENTRVAILIFDQDVRFAVPLTEVSLESRETILQSLEQINYKGLYTDSPNAIERAIYELKTNSRDEAKRLIVFMTDGIVDTGNADQDLEKARWLKQDLAEDAADSDIKIFGIAFTDNADFQLIQSLAQKTDGEYFRALQPENLADVFDQIQEIINRKPEPVVVAPEPQIIQAPPPLPPPPPPEPVIIEVPVQQPQAMDEEERFRSMIILIALGVIILAVIIMIFMLLKGLRKKESEVEVAQEAYFNDINGFTSKTTYKLGAKPTMLGRVAGKDTENLNYIVIPESTIGRRHALIEYKDFAYWIVDQGSINGTFVNNQPVTGETRLKHGDIIRLHKCEFEFSMPEMDAGETVISKTVMAAAGPGSIKKEDSTVAMGRTEAPEPAESTDLPEPDFDLDLTGGSEKSAEDEPPEPVEVDLQEEEEDQKEKITDETIILGNDDFDEDIPEATIRRDEEDEDKTTDDFPDTDKD